MIRFLFSWFGFIFSSLGILLFVSIGIWIWSLKAEVDRQSKALSSRANDTLDSANQAIGVVREIIEKAESDLAKTRSIGQLPFQPVDPLFRITAQKASQDLAGSVERAHSAVVLASEAVVVADAALDVVGGLPELKQMLGVKPEQLDATRTALEKVSDELHQARGILDVPANSSDGVPTTEQLYAVDDALHNARGFTDEVSKIVETTRAKVNETKQKVDTWSWRGAVATSLISALGMLGQFFMARFFWCKLWRSSSGELKADSAELELTVKG
jgi:hydrogenase maturation protease